MGSSSAGQGLCPVLLINAAFDVGLQPHAEDFAKRLRDCGAQARHGRGGSEMDGKCLGNL